MELKFTGERVVPDAMRKGHNPQHEANLHRILLEHLTRYKFVLQYCKDKKVLDVACGSGYGTQMISKVASKTHGGDNDPDTIEYAKEHYPGPKYAVVDLEEPPMQQTYDVIVSFETIEHLKNPHKFLKYASTHCEKFIFSIPINNVGEFHEVVYTEKEAKDLINTHFNKVDWYEQELDAILPFKEGGKFLIGIAYAMVTNPDDVLRQNKDRLVTTYGIHPLGLRQRGSKALNLEGASS